MPGKYYSNFTADRLQNWLSTSVDTVVTSGVTPWTIQSYIFTTLIGRYRTVPVGR